jgi:hypothetical protein
VPLAVREDWRSVLEAAAGTGTLHLWVAFHGTDEVHDRQVNRRGAYAETCQAIGRAHSAGLSVGCNVFLTTESLPQLDELTVTMGSLVDAGKCFETASYLPTPRSRRNERLRVTLPELAPVAARLAELAAPVNQCLWAGLESRTEAAYVRQALAGTGPRPRTPRPGNSPWCADSTSTSTRAWPACTGSGTATSAPTASPPCSAAPSLTAASLMTRCGSDRGHSPCRPNWPAATATLPGWGSTRDRIRCDTCGSTALSGIPGKDPSLVYAFVGRFQPPGATVDIIG